MLLDKQHFCLQYHDGWIKVRRYYGERLFNCSVIHRHTSPAPMLWCGMVLVYDPALSLVRITGTFTSYTPISLRFFSLFSFFKLRTYLFQRFKPSNAWPHFAHKVQSFFLDHHVLLLLCSAHFPDFSRIEYVWSITGKHLQWHAALTGTPYKFWLSLNAAASAHIPQ